MAVAEQLPAPPDAPGHRGVGVVGSMDQRQPIHLDSPTLFVTETLLTVIVDPMVSASRHRWARRLARQLGLPLTEPLQTNYQLQLVVRTDRLELCQDTGGRPSPFWVDLDRLDTRSPAGRSNRQPLARALKLTATRGGRPNVVDATAGFGGDAWLMASLGCRITAVERAGVVARMLKDGLQRARQARPDVARRVRVVSGDARQVLQMIRPRPDVVYLDPMFPIRSKRALERKAMRLMRQIVGHDTDAAALLELALRTATKRVIVKRPLHASPLAGQPAASHKGKSLRYDVYPTGGG